MNLFIKILHSYIVGILISSSIILFIMIFDYFLNGFFDYPELENLLLVVALSGFGFGLAHYSILNFKKSEKK